MRSQHFKTAEIRETDSRVNRTEAGPRHATKTVVFVNAGGLR